MNTKAIKIKIRRLLASLHSGSHAVASSNTIEQNRPLITIKEETEQDKFLNDFSFKILKTKQKLRHTVTHKTKFIEFFLFMRTIHREHKYQVCLQVESASI